MSSLLILKSGVAFDTCAVTCASMGDRGGRWGGDFVSLRWTVLVVPRGVMDLGLNECWAKSSRAGLTETSHSAFVAY